MTESKDDPVAAPERDDAPALKDPLEPDGVAASEEEPEGTLDAPTSATRRRLRAAVALTLVAAIIVFGALGGARITKRAYEIP
jgi:hypothetical protein